MKFDRKKFGRLIYLLAKAMRDNKTIVFNFQDKELIYAHRDWIVIEEGKKK